MSYLGTSYKTLKVWADRHVGIVMLSRPASYNAWTSGMYRELIDSYQKFEKDPNIRVIVITGDPAGKVFCSGADLRLGDFSNDRDAETDAPDAGGKFVLPVYRSRKITIAAINGSAAGIGITLTLPMDLRFVWTHAKIVFPFSRRGIVPEATSTYLLPKLIGRSQALAVFIQADPTLRASSPLLSGLFAHLLSNKEDVLPCALNVAHELASNTSPMSIAYMKSLVYEGTDSPEKQHMLDSRAMHILGNGQDSKEGAKAFLEKRKPVFRNFDTSSLPDWLRHHSFEKKGGNGHDGKKSKL